MTKPHYLGCAAGSQAPGIAAPAGYAWNVNLDNGNSNRNHQDNHYQALAVRAGECHDSASFSSLYAAYRAARRENAAPGCGVAIGNLSSQFFANIYLDRLDQFVKHELKATRYVRYVDDFVLVHHSREQLEAWLPRIVEFLRTELRLELKPDQRLRTLTQGIDFLGYVIFPTHTVVRRRVIAHVRTRLAAWESRNVRAGSPTARREPREQLRSVYASYSGHFKHASSYRLRQRLFERFTWLAVALRKTGNEQ